MEADEPHASASTAERPGRVHPPVRIRLQTGLDVETVVWLRVEGGFEGDVGETVLATVSRLFFGGVRRFVLDLGAADALAAAAVAHCVRAIGGLRNRRLHLVLVRPPPLLPAALDDTGIGVRVTVAPDLVSALGLLATARVA